MESQNQTPNYDAYQAEPETHAQVIEVLHRIGKNPMEQTVRLQDALVRQGTSESLARLLLSESEPGAVYI